MPGDAAGWRPRALDHRRRAARAGRSAAAGAVQRHQPGPGQRGHRAPLRAAGQPVLAGAARRRVHPAAAAARRAGRAGRARAGHHEPGRPGHRAGRRAHRRRAGGRRASGCASWCDGSRPAWLAVVGITAYRTAFDGARRRWSARSRARSARPGIWVLPNPSGLNAHYQLPALIAEFTRLHAAAPRLPPAPNGHARTLGRANVPFAPSTGSRGNRGARGAARRVRGRRGPADPRRRRARPGRPTPAARRSGTRRRRCRRAGRPARRTGPARWRW